MTADRARLVDQLLDDGRRAVLTVTERADGDLRVTGPPRDLDARRRAISDDPWTWLDQVHGAGVVTVAQPGGHAGARADGAVTTATGAPIAVHTADCAPIGLVGAAGVVGVAHAGWRGLVAGVVAETVGRMRALADGPITAVVVPCIHPECYEFGAADLDLVAEALGADVRAVTGHGTPALDLPGAARTALADAGVEIVEVDPRCTGCDPAFFSHRARADRGRQALLGWIEP